MTSEQFKAARLKLGRTQQSLAAALGVCIATLQRWEAPATVKSSTKPNRFACREVRAMLKELGHETE